MASSKHEPTITAALGPEPVAPSCADRRFGRALPNPRAYLASAMVMLLCGLHSLGIWIGLGGRAGLSNGWPLWRDDHPLYYHSALVTRSFLKASGTTAGYDPSFMAGYAKSVVFPASSPLPEVVVAVFGGKRPELAYKLYVLVSAAAVPWLVALAAVLWQLRPAGTAVAVALALVYIWTDFPLSYAEFGMLPYFLAVPLGLVATGAFARFLSWGGPVRWLIAVVLLSLAELAHLTAAMVVAPAAALAYVVAVRRGRRRSRARAGAGRAGGPDDPASASEWAWSRHLAVGVIPVVVLLVNSFWWLPGVWLASTKGPSDFAFAHSQEGVIQRLMQILGEREARIQSLLLATGLPGLFHLIGRRPVSGWALGGFAAAGMAWGYLAGAVPALDFLQPGRHTYAFFTGLALAGGAGVDEVFRRLRGARPGRDSFDRWVMVGAVLIALRVVGPPLVESVRARLGTGIREPFLSSRPSPRLLWVIDRVRRHLEPGQRLLYEEGGKDLSGVPDPFQRGRFSGLLPDRTGVEVIGGPYLHAALTTNFTQFGEGKLFGRAGWDRDHFIRYARLYRPAAILCWSPHARRFCRAHPDLIQILEDDGALLFGRVLGFGGDTIRGSARVEARPGRIRVHDLSPDLDGSVVLRYHSVPCLTTKPSVACEPEYLEEDPVPFIRLRPPPRTRDVDLELVFPGPR